MPGKHKSRRKYLTDGEPNPEFSGFHKGPGSKSGPSGPSGPSGKKPSLWELRDIVAWDGEGVEARRGGMGDGKSGGKQAPQDYVILANSRDEPLMDVNGLDAAACLKYLCDAGERHPHSIHVGFAFVYDSNMMLRKKGLSYHQVRELWHRPEDGTTEWEPPGQKTVRYYINYVPRHKLVVKRSYAPHTQTDKEGKEHIVYAGGICIWDCWTFFQTTFVGALERYWPDCPDLDIIRAGKAERGGARPMDHLIGERMLPYCQAECRTLEELVRRILQDVESLGLQLKRFDGAGAVSGALLSKHQVKEAVKPPPESIWKAAKRAYHGGRMELVRFGHYEGRLFSYDMASAYPWALTQLPDLSDGWWYERTPEETLGHERSQLTLYEVEWDLSDSLIYPFPFREGNGAIKYPPRGRGWYWAPEVNAALRMHQARKLHGTMTITRCFEFWPGNPDARPFAWVAELYAVRRQWEAEGHRSARILKLALNALYGKLIQKVGGARDINEHMQAMKEGRAERKRRPPYFSLEYAGLTTSLVRARMLEGALLEPDGLIFLATDGIFSTVPLTSLNLSDELGGWRPGTADAGTFVQPGIYFWKKDGVWQKKCRGFDVDSFTREDILAGYDQRLHHIDGTCTRPIGIGTASLSKERWREWCTWKTVTRQVVLVPESKRWVAMKYGPGTVDGTRRKYNPSRALLQTTASTSADFEYGLFRESVAYPVSWLDEYLGEQTLDGVEIGTAMGEWDMGQDA